MTKPNGRDNLGVISGTLVVAGSTAMPTTSQNQTLAADCDSVPGADAKTAIMKTHRAVNSLT
ncbi:MAG: hypothetical protein VX236_00105 [Pseudomonadota bacterium]|nr:hypothetical protein [Pseudomonadota bacterium]